jgi:bifunctional enzyme CysN/CysC
MGADVDAQGRGRRLQVVVAGHVDHGKSTVVGRLLADTGSLPQGKLEQVRLMCERTSKPFEYAFLLDALKDEQAQGITIDAARVFFRTARRPYLLLDAPGHIEFLKNMVTGASRAEAALLVIDALEGVQENSRRHGFLISLLGIRQLVVLVNKMDLVGHAEERFRRIVDEYARFLRPLGARVGQFIPVSARNGDNIAARSALMAWYQGPTGLEALEAFEPEPPLVAKPFRMPVQDVYKFTKQGDDRRIVAGSIESGTLRLGDEVVFYPSGKRARVKTIEALGAAAPEEVAAGRATGFTIEPQVYVARGDLAARATEPPPRVTTRLRVSLFWLGRQPLVRKKEYVLKLGTARVAARVVEFTRVFDASTLEAREAEDRVERHEIAECVLALRKAIACDLVQDLAGTSRFVLVDDFDIRGGGIVREAMADAQAGLRERVLLRNFKWEPSTIPLERRVVRYNQKPTLLLITGPPETDRKRLAKDVEARLFADGKLVYFLGMGNIVYGVDADLGRAVADRREHVRRMSEVANLMLDSGMILVVSAQELTQEELDLIGLTIDPELITTVWVGDRMTTDLRYDVDVPDGENAEKAVDRVIGLLADRGVIFQPW